MYLETNQGNSWKRFVVGGNGSHTSTLSINANRVYVKATAFRHTSESPNSGQIDPLEAILQA